MAVFRYFLSNDPSAAAPPAQELLTIEADSPEAVAKVLINRDQLPGHRQSLWAHVLVWSSLNGHQRGFQSFRLANPSP